MYQDGTTHIEQQLGALINVAKRDYLSSVEWVAGTNQMEETVRKTRHCKLRTVKLLDIPQMPPICYDYANMYGIPCIHAVAVIIEKHGFSSLHSFVAHRHLTRTWERQYQEIDYSVTSLEEMDSVICAAQKRVENRGLFVSFESHSTTTGSSS